MAKRFTATTKWDDPWFQDLDPALKCVWVYITDSGPGVKAWFRSLARWWRGLLVINPCPECGRGACDGWVLEDWDFERRLKFVKEWWNQCPAGHEWIFEMRPVPEMFLNGLSES